VKPDFKLRQQGVAERAADAAADGPWDVPDRCMASNWPAGTLAGGGVIAIVERDGGRV